MDKERALRIWSCIQIPEKLRGLGKLTWRLLTYICNFSLQKLLYVCLEKSTKHFSCEQRISVNYAISPSSEYRDIQLREKRAGEWDWGSQTRRVKSMRKPVSFVMISIHNIGMHRQECQFDNGSIATRGIRTEELSFSTRVLNRPSLASRETLGLVIAASWPRILLSLET